MYVHGELNTGQIDRTVEFQVSDVDRAVLLASTSVVQSTDDPFTHYAAFSNTLFQELSNSTYPMEAA
jgi:hypothetical protein